MSAFPIDDWQFWIATIVVLGALWFVIRPMIPRRGKALRVPIAHQAPSKVSRKRSALS